MPEDALVNTGAAQWPSPDSAYWAVREMQIKLHRWAGKIPPGGSATCSTSSITRRSCCTRGSAWRATSGRGRRELTGPRWSGSRPGSGSRRS